MTTAFSLLYNAVILPVTPASSPHGQQFQVSASRNDRGTPRFISPAWTEHELRVAFASAGTSGVEFEELFRGNRRATGGREAKRLHYTEDQLQRMGLTQETADRD